MARISTYANDVKPELGDKVIGTDANPNAALATKNYSLLEIAELLAQKNKQGVADQAVFKFQTDLTDGRESGTISFENGLGDGTQFSAITSMVLSKSATGIGNIRQYLNLFVGKEIILAQLHSINSFGTYIVDSITQHPTEDDFLVVNFSNFAANGALIVDEFYIFSEFQTNGDKNYVHTQDIASITWNVQHNLNKFPSCTMVLSSGQQGFGDVNFIDKNNLTITFTGAQTGKAYIN
jgi:hypothetical protein